MTPFSGPELNGGGGFPLWTCPSFFVLFRPFWDFPDFFGIFPICQGRILAVWILAPKLPNSDLKIAVDFWVDFVLLFFSKEKGPKNSTKKSTAKFTREFGQKNSPRISAEAFS